jgi:hypothetical protein
MDMIRYLYKSIISIKCQLPDATELQQAGAGCRTAASRVQKMVLSKPGGSPQGADDGVVEASEPPERPRPAPDEKPSKSVVNLAVIEHLA